MSTLVLTNPAIQPVQCSAQRDHANHALRCVLDAEIEALEGRLLQRSATAAAARGPARAEHDRQVGWLQDGMAKLQARRGAL
jgi:hypothetical protein